MKRPAGFTLIEMMITVSIVALLASVALPMGELLSQRAREQELRAALREIRGALDAYKHAVDTGRIIHSLEKSGYPPTLASLVEGVPDAAGVDQHARLYFLRRIPRDPFGAPGSRPEDGWGKRSYASPAEAPESGDDVYDVYSLAPGSGLNGVEYRQW